MKRKVKDGQTDTHTHHVGNIYRIVILYDWSKFVGHVKSLIIIISQMNFF